MNRLVQVMTNTGMPVLSLAHLHACASVTGSVTWRPMWTFVRARPTNQRGARRLISGPGTESPRVRYQLDDHLTVHGSEDRVELAVDVSVGDKALRADATHHERDALAPPDASIANVDHCGLTFMRWSNSPRLAASRKAAISAWV